MASQYKPYPKYKDSGIDWIGEIPEGWEVHRIKSFVPYIKNGQWGDDSSGGNNDFIVLRVADFLEFNFNLNKELTIRNIKDTKLKLKEGDLVVEKSGGGEKQIVGRVVQLKNSSKEKKYTYSNFIGKLEISNRMNKTFLNYYFKAFYNNRVNINYIKQTTGIQNLDSASLIQREYFAYPTDKNYQKSIVSFLDKKIAELDELIEKDKTLIELLKEKRTALINHAVTKGLDPNANMKDSGVEWIGKIPEEWEVRRLKFVLDNKKNSIKTGPFGSQLTIDEMYDSEYKVYNQKNVIKKDEKLGENYVSSEKFKELIAFKTSPSDLLITTRGTIGKTLRLSEEAEIGILHPCLMKINTNKEMILDRYMELIIEDSGLVRIQLQLKSCATTIDVVYQDNLKEIKLFIPPINKQRTIIEYLDKETLKIDKTIHKIQKKINLLEEYKKSLIHHAVTGKVDVRGSGI